MEQGKILDWEQIKKIDRIRRANAPKHIHTVSNSQYTRSNASKLLVKTENTKQQCLPSANENKSYPHLEHECTIPIPPKSLKQIFKMCDNWKNKKS